VLIEQEEKEISGVKAIGEQLDLWIVLLCHKNTSNEVSDLLILKNKAV
jgi:hypothetical protein